MTDADLAQAAWDAVMAATVTPQTWRKNVAAGKYPSSGPPSQFGIAHAALQQIIAGVPQPPPVSGAGNGLGYFRLASGGLASHPDDYATLIVSRSGAPAAAAHKGRKLTYMSGIDLSNNNYGITLDEARKHPTWLLRDANGNEIGSPYAGVSLADIGLPEYQQAWCAAVDAQLRAFGFQPGDGFYNDDALTTLSGFATASSIKYPAADDWKNKALVPFIQFAGQYMKQRGWSIFHNAYVWTGAPGSDNGALTAAFWPTIAPYVTGLMDEYWMRRPGHEPRLDSAAQWYWNWAGFRNLHVLCNHLGIDFIGLDEGVTGELAYQRYCLHSFLLDHKRPGSVHLWNTKDGSDPWTVANDEAAALGDPVETDAIFRNGRWERGFAGGLLWVDAVNGKSGIA